jgi:hypothetical protein
MFTRIGERGQKIEIEGAGFNVVIVSYTMGERLLSFGARANGAYTKDQTTKTMGDC